MSEPARVIGHATEGALRQMTPPPSETSAIILMIERAARDASVDIEKMEKLFAMHERMIARDASHAFDRAMTECQSEMRPVAADSNNPQTRSRYASYAALDKALRPIYTKHGFGLSFNTGEGAPENHVRVCCHVSHNGGHGRDYHIDMPADGKGAKGGDVMTKTHATGSAVTYGRRYLLAMMFNMAIGDDDDGNAAGDAGDKVTQEQIAELIRFADEVGADKIKFCTYMKIESLAALPASQYKRAVAALEAKRKKS